jgi:hypothetical protein
MASRHDNFLANLESARNALAETVLNPAATPATEQNESTRTRITRGLSGVGAAFNQLLDSTSMANPAASTSRSVPLHSTPAASIATEDGNALPGYRRTDPTSLASKEYVYESGSGKLEVTLQGAGQNQHYALFIRDVFDTIKGTVTVKLEKPESITSLKIRLKCVVSTAIVVARGNGRQPLSDEVQLFDEGVMLCVDLS